MDRRRAQLWLVAFVAAAGFAGAIALLAAHQESDLGIASTLAFRVGAVLLVCAFAVYVIEKELHLRRITQLLISERVEAAALTRRFHDLEQLHAAATAVNSAVVIDEILRAILVSASELLRPRGAVVMLAGRDGVLTATCTVGEVSTAGSRVGMGHGTRGRVAFQRRPLLSMAQIPDAPDAASESTMCIPLMHRTQLLGLLELRSQPGRHFTTTELSAATLFADYAAIAIANARLADAAPAESDVPDVGTRSEPESHGSRITVWGHEAEVRS